jgi:hypothetical protein
MIEFHVRPFRWFAARKCAMTQTSSGRRTRKSRQCAVTTTIGYTRKSAGKKGATHVAAKSTAKVEVENVNHPGQVRQVDAPMYEAVKRAYLKVLPKTSPGLTLAEIADRLLAHLPQDLFPDGAKAGWWAKTVQLDLEAKGLVVREKTKPLRLRKA